MSAERPLAKALWDLPNEEGTVGITKTMPEKKSKVHPGGRFNGSPTSEPKEVSARVHWGILRRAASTVRQRLHILAWTIG